MKYLFTFSIAVLFFFPACKKTSAPSTKDILAGKWVYSYSVSDANKNGVMDAAELAKPNLPLDSSLYPKPLPYMPGFILRSDGSGSTLDNKLGIQWLLYNNNTTLECIFKHADTANGAWVLSWLYTIDTITGPSLILKDTVGYSSSQTLHWFIYTKQ